ncbi:hypothetical protein HDU96_006655 [Phlyctochytrium bullatum]|nr:hypothetical protein HDU96_006655 [Phlyctochytrium bullatum]
MFLQLTRRRPAAFAAATQQRVCRALHGSASALQSRKVDKDEVAPAPKAPDDLFRRPGPIPLGDRKLQEEFENLMREREAEDANLDRHRDAREPLQSFEGDKNPVTGEIGGPKGAEPTRYGDWERKGR